MKYFTYIPLILLLGCSTINEQTGEKPLFDIEEIYCPPNTVTYCQGPNRKNMECVCIKNASIIFPDY